MNPKIERAVRFLDRNAERIHPKVAMQFVADENPGELILDAVSDLKFQRRLFDHDSVDAVLDELKSRSRRIKSTL